MGELYTTRRKGTRTARTVRLPKRRRSKSYEELRAQQNRIANAIYDELDRNRYTMSAERRRTLWNRDQGAIDAFVRLSRSASRTMTGTSSSRRRR